MPLVVPGLTGTSKDDEWRRKLVGKTLSDDTDANVSKLCLG